MMRGLMILVATLFLATGFWVSAPLARQLPFNLPFDQGLLAQFPLGQNLAPRQTSPLKLEAAFPRFSPGGLVLPGNREEPIQLSLRRKGVSTAQDLHSLSFWFRPDPSPKPPRQNRPEAVFWDGNPLPQRRHLPRHALWFDKYSGEWVVTLSDAQGRTYEGRAKVRSNEETYFITSVLNQTHQVYFLYINGQEHLRLALAPDAAPAEPHRLWLGMGWHPSTVA